MVVKKNIDLFWLPLELLDKRYTKQTRKWYNDEFKKRYNLTIVEGKQLTSKIETGSFLDAYGTNYYKFTQMANVAKLFREGKVKNGSIFFVDDLWFPGLEGIRYMEKIGRDTNIRIYGVMHAGSWIPSDDVATKLGHQKWCKEYERSLFDLVDGIFVGSQFHKDIILKSIGANLENKIFDTGLPFYPTEILKSTHELGWKHKDDIVIFPHRIHPEKHPEVFEHMAEEWYKLFPKWKFIKTMELNLDKQQYLDLLAKSKIMVSYADQENFGFSTLEAATLGCALVLPNRVVYPEFYPQLCLYKDLKECKEKVIDIMSSKEEPKNVSITKNIPYQFEISIERMCKVIENDKRK